MTPTPEPVLTMLEVIDAAVATSDMFGFTPALAFFVVFAPAAWLLWRRFRGSR